ncbi:AAA family ATPase [Hydrogenimonas thermophila]|uniref:ATP-binding protein n=1 Tax=Hydrogenimonas thermophila TaxID=223786 RepID=UPI0029373603|nr:AAA family ATPase [Hydrogenimonas thermophila]WOE70009.1 AAA family ATPase [Hydrogenimonas thermophila]WOE72526.1 AAA family ATPase [Hydrogenimonas thermophila]
MLKKLPIGIQTFSKIRENDYIYIDKTKDALELIENYTYVFLARPRRFGKSLFLDTLRNIFEGKKELFEGLYIYDKWDWSVKYPVIKISWDGRLRSIDDLDQKANEIFRTNQERLDIQCEESLSIPVCFERLIKEAYKKYNQKVVVLIDEYDKPILDVIEEKDQAKEHREYIKGLYSTLKGVDEYIRFAFLTGVSKFSKASIFSGLNNLEDISLTPKFGNICGYTQNDLETTFKEYLQDTNLQKIKEWYNGYNFLKDDVYNPFDILKFIRNDKVFDNYWFSSGTPTFLIKLIEKNNYFLPKLSNLVVGKELVDSFDIENINLEVILYQSGYLTIDEMIIDDEEESIEYKLKLPNREVKVSFNDYIINYLLKDTNPIQKRRPIRRALKNGNLEEFKNALDSIFASIPYNNYSNNYIQNYEGFYATVVYVYLQSLGIKLIGEDVTNKGRIDLTLFIEDKIYIIEFKVVDNAENRALEQIKEKKYYQKYLNPELQTPSSKIYLVGIEFGKKEKNIVGFKWEEVN